LAVKACLNANALSFSAYAVGRMSSLVNRNIVLKTGRTSMRLEPELWDALWEICRREHIAPADLVERAEVDRGKGGRTSAVRVYLLRYFRAAASPVTRQGPCSKTTDQSGPELPA
jgi:predicted DNA-binding ribbon-helix-helix protein